MRRTIYNLIKDHNNKNTHMKIGLYKHYKGKLYQVLSIARHSETLEELVVYQALYGEYGIWVRPKDMFCSNIEINGETKDRFQFIQGNITSPPKIN